MIEQDIGESPTIYPATGEPRQRSPWRLTVVALVLMALLGAVGGGWLVHYLEERGLTGGEAARPAPVTRIVSAAPATAKSRPVPLPSAEAEAGIAARVGALEERLGRISLAAESASGNAARAEALLVAFAARRAIERGLPLGGMEAQLRLRFGESQPNAVQSIISESANPVTKEQLVQRLETLRPALVTPTGSGWFSRIGDGLSSLVVVRSADTPSPAPSRRFDRAMRAVQGGMVDKAILEIDALPGRQTAEAQAWLNDARRYNDAMRSLDLIETAAILEPGQARMLAGGQPVATVKPDAP